MLALTVKEPYAHILAALSCAQVSFGLSGAGAPSKPVNGKRPAHTQQELPGAMRRVKALMHAPAAPMAESKTIQADAEPSAEDAHVLHKTVRHLRRIVLSAHCKAQDEVLELWVCRQ